MVRSTLVTCDAPLPTRRDAAVLADEKRGHTLRSLSERVTRVTLSGAGPGPSSRSVEVGIHPQPLAAGLGAGTGTVLLLENLKGSISHVDQLKDLGVQVLAIIPSIQDETLLLQARRRDMAVYAASGLYLCAVVALLGMEFLRR